MSDINLVQVEGLTVILGGRVALDDITLNIRAGSFTGILGPNGAGKSTLLKVLLGLIHPQRGSVLVFGHKPGDSHGLIGYVPQSISGLVGDFPVSALDVVMMGRLGPDKIGRRYGNADRAASMEAMEAVGIEGKAQNRFGSLSGGERQKALIARALCAGPKLLLLDEPTTGVDPVAQDDFYAMLTRLKDANKITIALVSHDVGVITSMVDDLICLNQKVFLHGPPEEALKDGMIGKTYGSRTEIVMHGHDVPHRHLPIHGEGGGND
ncbi:MAG: metal ABC transporter ATP-binding protein [Nitrospinota bacterium]|nr:metal ABC transporter ATP-binding protein [Nitrospinota bacterium]